MTFTPIGQTGQTLAAGSPTEDGNKHGATASVTKRPDTSAIAEWLGDQHPRDMDKAALSRALSHGAGLKVRYEGRYPTGPSGEHLPSYEVAVWCDLDGSPEAADAALADLRNFMTPAPMRKVEEWIARMSVVTAKRKDDEFSEELRVMEYASRLSQYPADVVRSVLLQESYKFFPTWDELRKRCEALTSPRRHMIAALERGPEPPEPVRRPPTQEERERVQALVDETFPQYSEDYRRCAVDEALKGNCMTDQPEVGQ